MHEKSGLKICSPERRGKEREGDAKKERRLNMTGGGRMKRMKTEITSGSRGEMRQGRTEGGDGRWMR